MESIPGADPAPFPCGKGPGFFPSASVLGIAEGTNRPGDSVRPLADGMDFHPEPDFGDPERRIIDPGNVPGSVTVVDRLFAAGEKAEVRSRLHAPLGGVLAFNKLQESSFPGISQAESGIVLAHRDKARRLSAALQLRIGAKGYGSRHREIFGGEFPQEEIRTGPEVRFFLFPIDGI